MQVLVVDDDTDSIKMLESLLKGSGYKVSVAVNGKDALDYLEKEQVDLIISDILMPKMDGFQLCRAVKADETLKQIPFVFYTATYTTEEDREFALSLGASRFILKPTDPDQFIKMIKEFLAEGDQGLIPPGKISIKQETEYLREHQLRLIGKLGDKIAQLEQSEVALRRSEAKFRAVVQNSNDGILFCDANALISYRSPSYNRINGYTDEDRVGHNGFETVHPDDLDALRESWAQIVRHPEMLLKVAYRIRHKNGTWRWVETTVQNLLANTDVQEIVVTSHDITERKLAEELLKKSEEKFAKFFMLAPAGISVSSFNDGRIFDVNKEFERSFGYSRDEIIGRTSSELGIWFDVRDRDKLSQLIRTEVKVKDLELRLRTKNGNVITHRVFADLIEINNAPYLLSAFVDITERKKTEESLRESEIRFRAVFENSRDAIGIAKNGMHYFANPAYLKLFGYGSNEEIVGTSILNSIAPSHHQQLLQNIQLRTAEKPAPSLYVTRGRKTDDTEFFMEISASTFELQGEIFTIANIRDITEQLREAEEKAGLEDQLRQAQKMEAIGQLAGGIAHDFNNLLMIFSTYGHILGDKLKNDDLLRPYAERIVEATEKAAGLTQSLLAFSRKQTISLKSIDLNEIIRKVDHFLHRIIGEDIELKASLAGAKLTVMADSGQIEQVLMNLATNARDAMPRGGLLSIHSEIVQLADADVKAGEVERAGMYARISVSDTGQGMDKSTLERIFEPFFTTKDVGKGTGLGLAIVYGIIKQHGGTVRVYSEPGKGTTFRIYLPLMRPATEKLEVGTLPAPRGGDETILLVEDNAAVRKSIKVILEDAGYNVIEAIDGEDALAEFNRHRDEIMLLLSDVIMPKMNGKEVYDAIRGIRQDMKALFISGYTADIITSKGLLDEGLHLMYKPPAPDALKRKIRELLDSKQGFYE